MCHFHFQPVLSEERIEKNSWSILPPAGSFCQLFYKSMGEWYSLVWVSLLERLEYFFILIWWYEMFTVLRDCLSPTEVSRECWRRYPELLEAGVAPFTAVGSRHGAKTNARGVLKRHEPWDLFASININIKLSENEKREEISMKEQKNCKKQTKHNFLIGLCIF